MGGASPPGRPCPRPGRQPCCVHVSSHGSLASWNLPEDAARKPRSPSLPGGCAEPGASRSIHIPGEGGVCRLRLPWSSGVGDGSPAAEGHPSVGRGHEPHPPPAKDQDPEQGRGWGKEGGAGPTGGPAGGREPLSL